MKAVYLLTVILLACNDVEQNNMPAQKNDSIIYGIDTATKTVKEPQVPTQDTVVVIKEEKEPEPASQDKVYSNKRFKDVTVEKAGENKYTVRGKGQIFEANFGWVVEDGHNELKKGFEMTDAGAPAWGNFNFTIDVKKERPNSTLTLILFETSAKDGSRQYLLPIPLK